MQMQIPALVLLVVAVVGSTSWAVHLLRAGIRDSRELAAKLAIPHPRRAADWPELRLDAVVIDPEGADHVLVVARWPAHPDPRALLVLAVDDAPVRARRLLAEWRDSDTSLSPRFGVGGQLVLRQRRTRHEVRARVVKETT
ncbi:MAG TPA: hypothetical protein VL119_05190 [Acidimicrobiia bacterium]|nr:hypothetical protein [Acidimicrobiia bacterium]